MCGDGLSIRFGRGKQEEEKEEQESQPGEQNTNGCRQVTRAKRLNIKEIYDFKSGAAPDFPGMDGWTETVGL